LRRSTERGEHRVIEEHRFGERRRLDLQVRLSEALADEVQLIPGAVLGVEQFLHPLLCEKLRLDDALPCGCPFSRSARRPSSLRLPYSTPSLAIAAA
jgi:hypothetical protein